MGASDGEEPSFVGHVVLCDIGTPAEVSAHSSRVSAVHMGPPLKQSEAQVDIVATAELDAGGISKGERRQIKAFLDDRLLERRAQQERQRRRIHPLSEYLIHPAAREPTADVPLWRFNCAGFVMHAYLEANIELISEQDVPRVSLGFLKAAYPTLSNRLDEPDFRKEMGIDDGDDWPVAMAGYIVHSLNRSAAEIRQTPYAPQAGDECFPARPAT